MDEVDSQSFISDDDYAYCFYNSLENWRGWMEGSQRLSKVLNVYGNIGRDPRAQKEGVEAGRQKREDSKYKATRAFLSCPPSHRKTVPLLHHTGHLNGPCALHLGPSR